MQKTTLENGSLAIMADEGKWLTNAKETAFSKLMYLGVEDSPDNYHQVTDEERNAILAERESVAKNLKDNLNNEESC